MPDLRDGQSVEVRGSAAQPYRLKNVGGVYSCSCPAWRNQSLPIEGELWLGRRSFQRALGIVRRQDGSDLWREVRYVVFDAPGAGGGFEDRLRLVAGCLAERRPEFARAHPHAVCTGLAQLRGE